ncbi:AAA family ATPase [bacterium]|jgi:transitional endoplasmic reticulum ATPase|nr:AAA family ATPase [bacterium]|tara:strand:+ start:10842 stop:12902 length:2061 start_codon:yes stop_codon:yes gene_type:complete
MTINLIIEDIGVKDAGKGFARITSRKMTELGLQPLDVIEICGQRKSAIRVMPMSAEDDEKHSCIKIDGITRQNIKSTIKDKIVLKKVELLSTNKIVLSPANSKSLLFMSDTKILLSKMNGLVVSVGDKLFVKLPGNKSEEFNVLSTNPSSSSVIDSKTKIEIKRVKANSEPKKLTTYSDIGGLSEQLKKIKDLIELPLKHPEIFSRLGIEPPRGLLLVGPPGTGKTLLARAIAQECGVNFTLVNGPEIVRKFYGESEALLREIFQSASDKQPSILFIDEIDAVAPKRDRVHGEVEKRIVGQLLALMDGLKDRGKVIVLAATNMPNSLDPALRRPGRFDKEITLDPPNLLARKEILEIHSRGMPLDKNVDFDTIASSTSGFVGADLEMVCKDAALISVQKLTEEDSINYELLDSILISNENFIEAAQNIEPSAIREIFVETPKVEWSDIGGLSDVKEILEKVVIEPIKKNKFRERMPKGVMLYGPPGSGKTMLAKALANTSGMNFISIKGPELISKYLGESEELLKDFFNKARQVSPSILFFDEIDSICSSSSQDSSFSSNHRIMSQLLLEMDGFKDLSNVVVLAATNKIENVDSALLRSGRFDLLLETTNPGKDDLRKIFNIKLKSKKIKLLAEFDYNELIDNFNGADIDTMFNLAVQFTNKLELDYSNLEKAANQIRKRKRISNT